MARPARNPGSMTGAHGHAIAQLSNSLRLPLDEVATVYQSQLDHIGASARIHNYLSVLVTRRTRAILRGHRQALADVH